MTNIGIVVVTRNRRKELAQVLDAIEAHTHCTYELAVALDRCEDDTQEYLHECYTIGETAPNRVGPFTILHAPEPGGIAANRNVAFHHFRDKDVVFMFEDDYYPLKDGWERPYVRVLESGFVPCLFALNRGHGNVVHSRMWEDTESAEEPKEIEVLYRPFQTTQMIAIHTGILKTVGYFNPAYGTRYGFEDGEWAERGRNAGFFHYDKGYPCLYQEGVFQDIANPSSSDGKTEAQRIADIDVNREIFIRHGVRPTFLPYPH